MIHLDSFKDKLNLLVFMAKKLFALAHKKCAVEGVDSPMMQECLVGGHVYLQVLKDRIHGWMVGLRSHINKRVVSKGGGYTPTRGNYSAHKKRFFVNEIFSTEDMAIALRSNKGFEFSLETFLSTGNITSQSGLGLMQNNGMTVVAENINRMRYMSHFRAIHRGSFFTEMRTTEVRQLLPDAWGENPPTHTPPPCLRNFLEIPPSLPKLRPLKVPRWANFTTPPTGGKSNLGRENRATERFTRVLGACEISLEYFHRPSRYRRSNFRGE